VSPLRLAFALLLGVTLAACSSTAAKNRVDYKKAEVTAPLDVPPPMKAPVEGNEGLELPAGEGVVPATVLPQATGVRVVRYGDMRWLEVEGAAEELWPKVREFWTKQGFELVKQDAPAGILETQWAENRADIPEGAFRSWVSKLAPNLYSAHTRDKYRTRLERGSRPGVTEVFVAHYGVEQVDRGESTGWQPRPSDPELVAEMMTRFMLFLGVSEERAKLAVATPPAEAPRAALAGEQLVMNEGFARAWRLAGIALDRVGLVVEDLDRAKGLYYVRQTESFAPPEKKGWFEEWFADKPEDKRFQILVKGDDAVTRIAVQTAQGEPASAADAKLILSRLQEQLR